MIIIIMMNLYIYYFNISCTGHPVDLINWLHKEQGLIESRTRWSGSVYCGLVDKNTLFFTVPYTKHCNVYISGFQTSVYVVLYTKHCNVNIISATYVCLNCDLDCEGCVLYTSNSSIDYQKFILVFREALNLLTNQYIHQ